MARKKPPRIDAPQTITVEAIPAVTYDRLHVRHLVLRGNGHLTLVLRPYSGAKDRELDDERQNIVYTVEDIFALAETDSKADALVDAIYDFAKTLVG